MKTNDDVTFTMDGNIYPLKAFVPENIYLGKLSKVFQDAHSKKNMGLSLNPYEKNNKWRERKKYRRTLKASETKADTK